MAMNSVTPTTSDYQKLRKAFTIEKRPFMMLKDYLLDDLSSCSSNGFKSFPRRQCCTSLKLPTELDVKTKPKTLRTSRSNALNNALQRASLAFLNAVRLISLPSSVKSLTPSPSKKALFLPRSFSRKLFRKSFWRKSTEKKAKNESCNDIKRWKSFREYLEEKDQPLDFVSIDTSNKTNTTITTSWDDNVSIFSSENLMSSEISINRNGVDDEISKSDSTSENNVSNKKSGAANGEESPETTTITSRSTTSSEDSNMVWSSDKEQLSPVSVLDCPFEDDEDITSPFPCGKQKHRPKTRRLESLSQLEPIDLEKRIQPSSAQDTKILPKEEELLYIISTTYPIETSTLQVDNLLLDFFAESLPENENNVEQELLNVAQHWIKGHPLELYLGWEVKEQRKVYLRDMEKDGMWKMMDEEKQELVHALEIECWTSLVNELVSDLLHW